MNVNGHFSISGREVGNGKPVYFIADIGANHDRSLERAIELIYLAAEVGADAAKFQHFQADTIVSDVGFKCLGNQKSHQAGWKKSVFEVYKDASLDLGWTPYLKQACDKAGIAFFTSPYAVEIVDEVDPFVPAYKIGSGDITWTDMIEYVAKKNKPCILASGASTLQDVQRAIEIGLQCNPNIALLQCNTNYTARFENFKYIHLNVLKTFRELYPTMPIGLSDHTLGHTTVLGAVALGASIIEKHFTDDTTREGPDHAFAMDPKSWKEMVDRSRELELSLGTTDKNIEPNELETVVLQRRAIRVKKDLAIGSVVIQEDCDMLRPCPRDAIQPFELKKIVGKRLTRAVFKGDYLKWADLA